MSDYVCACVCVFIKQSFGFLSTDKSVINQSNQESACDSNPSRLNFNKHSCAFPLTFTVSCYQSRDERKGIRSVNLDLDVLKKPH